MDISKVVINIKETMGERPLLIDYRPSFAYKDGIKGEQDGLKVTCLSEKMGYEKVDIKLPGMLSLPFEFDGNPMQVEFEEISGKLWQDWSNKGTIKLSVSANGIKPLAGRRKIQLNE